jgi:5-methyltetrahydrofolate--homocysteine methyltransferase
MHVTLERLLADGPVLTDGAWGTQLQQRGLPLGECPDKWNLEHPEKVEEVAYAYLEAGSRVILTNTFGSNRFVLSLCGLADRVVELNRAGVEISRRAVDKWMAAAQPPQRPAVFASMGPSGMLIMAGQVTEDALQAAFDEQARALVDAGADGVVIETMSDLVETSLAVAAVRATGLPVVASMTFDSGANHDRTMMGVTPERAAELLTAVKADVVGSNCGRGSGGMIDVCRRLRASTDRPIWIKANAGLPEVVDGKTVYRQTPPEFAAHVPQLIEAGASFIGGCCGTTPAFVRAVARELKPR